MGDKRKQRRKRGQADAGDSQSPELGRDSQRDAAITESSYKQGAGAPLSKATFTRALEVLKRDICNKLDCKIDTVTHTLRSEISSVKAEFKAAITTLQATINAQGTTIKDLELSATTCSDDLTSLQSAVSVLTEEFRQLQAKCEDLEGRSRRNNIHLIGVPEGLETSNPREFISHLLLVRPVLSCGTEGDTSRWSFAAGCPSSLMPLLPESQKIPLCCRPYAAAVQR
ncbi:unnamed protein product [Oreochromis niloticus]|nr:unnamed protein product [Mustela putorius furo]